MTMLNVKALFGLALAALLTGCGGGGEDDRTPVPTGRYVGSWSKDGEEIGTLDITVAEDRSVSGTVQLDSDLPATAGIGTTSGTVRRDGNTRLRFFWAESQSGDGYSGTLRYRTTTGTLEGSLNRDGTDTGVVRRSTWTLTRQQ